MGLQMVHRRTVGVLLVVILGAMTGSLVSCAGQRVRAYSGPARPAEEVAVIVTLPYNSFEDAILAVREVDGRRAVAHRKHAWVELLPGRHELFVIYYCNILSNYANTHAWVSGSTPMTVNLQAGRTYLLFPILSENRWGWHPALMDISDPPMLAVVQPE